MYIFTLHNHLIRRGHSSQLALYAWWALALLGLVGARLVQIFWLDPAYVDSQYPVPFYVGQTTFNAAELKGYYQVMLDKGTLPLYWLTQWIDFVFIACTYGAFFALSQSIYHSIKRLLPRAGRVQTIARIICFIAPLAAIADFAENLVSFVMLLQPQNFADALVYPYSSFAVIKFALFALTYLWAAVAILLLTLVLAGRAAVTVFTAKRGLLAAVRIKE